MKKHNHTYKHKVIANLDKKEMDFLNKLGTDSYFSTGHKLTYNEILKGLVDLAMDMGVSGEHIRSAHDLENKLFEKLKNKVKGLERKEEDKDNSD